MLYVPADQLPRRFKSNVQTSNPTSLCLLMVQIPQFVQAGRDFQATSADPDPHVKWQSS
jgi:hypothetical protein